MHTLVVGKWVGLLYFEMWYSCFREKDFTGNPSAKKRPTFRTVYAQCRVLLPTPALKPRAFRNFSFLSSSCRTRRVPGAAKSESPAPAEAKGKGKQEDAAVAEKEEEEEPQRKEGMLQVGARSAEDGAGAATAGPALPPTVRGAGEGTRSTTHSRRLPFFPLLHPSLFRADKRGVPDQDCRQHPEVGGQDRKRGG